MRQGTLLRILILAIGLHLLAGSISGISTSLWSLRGYQFLDLATRDYHWSILIGYGIFPLVGASFLLLFSQRIARSFLGGQADTTISDQGPNSSIILSAALKVLGVYFLCTYGSAMAATVYEMIAVKAGNNHFSEEQVTTDTIANLGGLVLAFALCFNTSKVISFLSEKEK